jgi:hypothetical protein
VAGSADALAAAAASVVHCWWFWLEMWLVENGFEESRLDSLPSVGRCFLLQVFEFSQSRGREEGLFIYVGDQAPSSHLLLLVYEFEMWLALRIDDPKRAKGWISYSAPNGQCASLFDVICL